MRPTAEKRHNDWIKAIRKRNIDRQYQNGSVYDRDYYDNLHEYSKNKIHCSCGMCARWNKTNNKGKHRAISGNYAPSKNWSPNDQRKRESMDSQLEEYETEEE